MIVVSLYLKNSFKTLQVFSYWKLELILYVWVLLFWFNRDSDRANSYSCSIPWCYGCGDVCNVSAVKISYVGSIEIAKSSVKKVEGSIKQEKKEKLTPDMENCTATLARGMKLMRKEVRSDELVNTGTFKVRIIVKNMEVDSANVLEVEIILLPGADNDGEELYTPDKENSARRSLLGLKFKKKGILEEMKNQHSNSLRSKVSIYEDREAEEVFTPGEKNITPGRVLGTKSKKKGRLEVVKNQSSGSLGSEATMCSNFLQVQDQKCEEEIFSPDKENFSTRPALGMISIENGELEEMKNFESPNLMFITTSNSNVEEGMFNLPESDKVNLAPMESKKSSSTDRVRNDTEMILSKRAEGNVPFQSLLSPNSISKSKSEFSAPYSTATKNCDPDNFSRSTERNCVSFLTNQSFLGANNIRWNMVVDTGSLLDKDSWKFEVIKGTHLNIPRMVIKVLDSLKRRGSLQFNWAAEVFPSSSLDWIEECVIKTNWWMHVQSVLEESLPIAPTSPASPLSGLTDMSHDAFGRALQLSSFGSLMEIASPTAQYKNSERLVFLSSSVALKIKAMAEGLIRGTADEFRECPVNPYLERFMWAGRSAARGPTWSSFNDAPVVRGNSAEGAKGLQLILLQNSSHYGKITTCTVN
ncbi:hypothetical protein MKW94_013817 [Papaver nudicaule]|uniref:PIN domain-containing protein n=1 Tax=Papaver nudicaule TaxID=74823 RepID=A0AA41S4N9_PAPNU|nr:hypothetical protein [Papaver nudicaule]